MSYNNDMSSRKPVALTWLKNGGDSLIHFTICRLPVDYSGESFWTPAEKIIAPSFANVTYTSEHLRIVCEASLVPSDILKQFAEGDFVGFSFSMPLPSILPALHEKFGHCGAAAPEVVALLDNCCYLIQENDVSLVQCAVQELWDEHYLFSFLGSP